MGTTPMDFRIIQPSQLRDMPHNRATEAGGVANMAGGAQIESDMTPTHKFWETTLQG